MVDSDQIEGIVNAWLFANFLEEVINYPNFVLDPEGPDSCLSGECLGQGDVIAGLYQGQRM